MGSPVLLLDVGGVVLRSTHEMMGRFERFAARRGRLGPEPDPAWEDALAGRIGEREYWAARAREAGLADVHALMGLLYEGADLFRPEAVALMDDAHAIGLVVGALTNDLAFFYGDGDLTRHAVLRRFDVIVDGSDTGVLKPDPRAYELAVEALGGVGPGGISGTDVVYLDDMPANLDAARAAGFRTVAVDLRCPAEAFTTARTLLGLAREVA